MNNEHLEDTGHIEAPETNGSFADDPGFDSESSPLDPSVFFGLFDDLDETSNNGDGHVQAEAEDQLDADPDSDSASDSTQHANLEESVAETSAEESNVDESPAEEPTEGAVLTEDPANQETSDGDSDGHGETDSPGSNGSVGTGTQLFADQNPSEKVTLAPAEAYKPPAVTDPGLGRPSSPPPIPEADGAAANGQAKLASPPNVATQPTPKPTDAQTPPITLPVQTERAGSTMATAALITIAVGLFGGLIIAFILSLRSPEIASDIAVDQTVEDTEDATDSDPETSQSSSTAIDGLSLANVSTALQRGAVDSSDINQLVAAEVAQAVQESRLDSMALTFERGSTELTPSSSALVDQLGVALADSNGAPLTATVRTYSEPSAADNLTLSRQQATALIDALVAAGASPDQVRAAGLGSTPLSQAQPVPAFVEVTAGFGDNRLSQLIGDVPNFAIGENVTGESASWLLRVEGLTPLTRVGRALQLSDDANLGLAGYSFAASTEDQNRSIASNSTATVSEFLAENFDIDGQRISVINPGSAPHIPPPEVDNLVWITAGPETQARFDAAGIDTESITFSGVALTSESETVVEALGAALSSSETNIVIDVRSYENDSDSGNLDLSRARGDSLAASLEAAGIAAERIRAIASGASSHFSVDGPLVTVTVVP